MKKSTIIRRLKALKIDGYERFLLSYRYPWEAFRSGSYKERFAQYRDKKKIVLTLVPYHDNLGDHAIAYSTRQLLAAEFPDYEVIEVNIRDIYTYAKGLRDVMRPDDYVFILGGGNMGDLYRNEEWTRRFILRTFTSCRVVQLPVTIHFTKTTKGDRELRQAKKVYQAHPNLLMMVRDATSYEFAKKHFPMCPLVKQPDMVLSLNETRAKGTRHKVMVALREDRESFLGNEAREKLLEQLNATFGTVERFSTTVGRRVDERTRAEALQQLWASLRQAKVVITDRLHGMLFCAITGTPCVAIRSFDHKVTDGYEWLKNIDTITHITTPTEATVLEAVKAIEANHLGGEGASHQDGQGQRKGQLNLADKHFHDFRKRVVTAFEEAYDESLKA